jgi:hypothetical protein
VKQTPSHPDRAEPWPAGPQIPATNTHDCTPDGPHTAKEALKALVRSLARADAIDDYRRRHSLREGDHESGNLRSV